MPTHLLAADTLSSDAVSAGYAARQPILHEVSVFVRRGEVAALIGPNGSGKSTLLRVLGGALKPFGGHVTVSGESVYKMSARTLARSVAFVPQDNPAPFAFTVEELIALGANAAEPSGAPPADARIENALRLFDLLDFAGRSLTNLSGGERQRAALARAWAQNTPFVLLDEPTAHLDLRHQSLLIQAVQHAARVEQRAVLLVLHDLNLAHDCADQFFLLDRGRVVARGAAGDVLIPPVLEPVYQTSVRRVTGDDQSVWLRTS